MNVLFLTVSRINDVHDRGIYCDLMREFIRHGHKVYIASPTERRFGKKTHIIESDDCRILKVRTLNIQKTNVIEKGIGTLLLERQFQKAIRKHWGDVKFDLVIYSTPPITFNNVIENVKKHCGAPSYLLLKDIFPQNAVDLGMMKNGSFLHRMFRKKERRLYEISDYIGCMSPANCRYVLKENPSLNPSKVEVCPNSIELTEMPPKSDEERNGLLSRYGIPTDRTLFIYGGNLGKPQGVDFLIHVADANEGKDIGHIVIVGNGTEFGKLQGWYDANKPKNTTLLQRLPKEDYDKLVRYCDVGLIFLDRRFTIPNYPSRLLSYLEYRMPVLAATDVNTDIGSIAEENGYGLWSESGDLDKFLANMNRLASDSALIKAMGENGYRFLLDNYTVDKSYDIIKSHFRGFN